MSKVARIIPRAAAGLLILFCSGAPALTQEAAAKPAPAKPAPAKPAPAKSAPAPASKAAAPADTSPDVTTATYGSWVHRCQKTSSAVICELNQTLSLQGQTEPFAMVALGRVSKETPLLMIAQVPVNASLATAPELVVGGAPQPAKFVRCLPNGCFIEIAMSEALTGKMLNPAGKVSVRYVNGQEQTVELAIALNGFASAFSALDKQR